MGGWGNEESFSDYTVLYGSVDLFLPTILILNPKYNINAEMCEFISFWIAKITENNKKRPELAHI